jgi:sucrose-6-phosphate hydrolase SacC (GH32 family)
LLSSINPGGPNGGSATQYFVGNFDGKKFSLLDSTKNLNGKAQWIDWGTDNYAGVTWNNVPNIDGRRLFMGWMNNWTYGSQIPESGWRGSMTIPREISLVESTDNSYILASNPVRELKLARRNNLKIPRTSISESLTLTSFSKLNGKAKEVELEIGGIKDSILHIMFSDGSNQRIIYLIDPIKKQVSVDRSHSGLVGFNKEFERLQVQPWLHPTKTLKLRFLLDASSIELFADDGSTVSTVQVFPTKAYSKLDIASKEKIELLSANVWNLGK